VNRSSWPDPAAPGAKPVKLLDRPGREASEYRRASTVQVVPFMVTYNGMATCPCLKRCVEHLPGKAKADQVLAE
jgi:hypothetical protein